MDGKGKSGERNGEGGEAEEDEVKRERGVKWGVYPSRWTIKCLKKDKWKEQTLLINHWYSSAKERKRGGSEPPEPNMHSVPSILNEVIRFPSPQKNKYTRTEYLPNYKKKSPEMFQYKHVKSTQSRWNGRNKRGNKKKISQLIKMTKMKEKLKCAKRNPLINSSKRNDNNKS